MTQHGDENIANEVNSRLDAFFSDPDESPAPSDDFLSPGGGDGKESLGASKVIEAAPAGPSVDGDMIAVHSPLFELNAIILSIDWEISDETMSRLLEEIERLKGVYRNDKLPLMFLQLHGSVGKYISARKASAHPDSIKLLHSIYKGMQQVIESTSMGESEKKKILAVEVEKFKKLKEQILIAKADVTTHRKQSSLPPPKRIEGTGPVTENRKAAIYREGKPSVAPDAPKASDNVDMESDRIQEAVEELKQIIREEIASLKSELRALISG